MGARVLLRLKCKAGMEQEYRERHEHVWDSVKADLAQAGVASMNIWMERNDVYLLMELAPGVSYAAATRVLDSSPNSVQWEEYMEPIMLRSKLLYADPAFHMCRSRSRSCARWLVRAALTVTADTIPTTRTLRASGRCSSGLPTDGGSATGAKGSRSGSRSPTQPRPSSEESGGEREDDQFGRSHGAGRAPARRARAPPGRGGAWCLTAPLHGVDTSVAQS